MKSCLKILSCAASVLLCASSIKAAPLHGDYGQEPSQGRIEWFSVLHQQQNSENPLAFASEKFRNIPQGKIVSLTFDKEDNDPLGLISSGFSDGSDQFNNKWVGLLFGMRSWEIEENSSYIPISAQSTSAIPLPAGFTLFIAGLGGILFLGWLKKRTRNSRPTV